MIKRGQMFRTFCTIGLLVGTLSLGAEDRTDECLDDVKSTVADYGSVQECIDSESSDDESADENED